MAFAFGVRRSGGMIDSGCVPGMGERNGQIGAQAAEDSQGVTVNTVVVVGRRVINGVDLDVSSRWEEESRWDASLFWSYEVLVPRSCS